MLKLVTAATEEPVSLPEIKGHLNNIPDGSSDGDLTEKLLTAREYIEDETGRALVTSSWAITLPCWPACGFIELPLGNLQAAGPITYRCSDGTVKTWASTEYRLERVYVPSTDGVSDCGIGRIYLSYAKFWPADVLDVGEPITIPFTCGWAPGSVPSKLKQAVELVAATLYRNRESTSEGNTAAVFSALTFDGKVDAVSALCSRYVDRRF